ncbi:MAG: response regulator transcription factor [Deltaproteobacteria bacterium]|nr:response regulator transcription factor [Deltaproteobacteria bacterium]
MAQRIILHLEDFDIHGDVVARHLSAQGDQVWLCKDAKDFFEALTALAPDELDRTFVLLDVGIGADREAGISVYRRLRKEFRIDLPVLFVTIWQADRLEAALPEIRDRVAVGVLSKPFSLRELDSALEALSGEGEGESDDMHRED